MGSSNTVFISYSHKNGRRLERLLVHLKPLEQTKEIAQVDIWSDRRLKVGDDWKREIDGALARANVAIVLVSADFLASDFITKVELPSLLQAVERRSCKVVAVIIGFCQFSSIQNLQRFQAVNSPGKPLEPMRKSQAEEILSKVATAVADHLADRESGAHGGSSSPKDGESSLQPGFVSDPRVDLIITCVRLADWGAAEKVALQIIAETEPSGRNDIFESLLNYQESSDEDERLWGALHTIECCVRLAPWLITHAQLSRMAEHQNFSVRSTAASICMDLAHSAPDRVPLDLVMKLSVYNEDWYVQAPANAALKAMARTIPEVLRMFHMRLRSSDFEESVHSASGIREIADKEPGLLDAKLLKSDLVFLKTCGNVEAERLIRASISKVRRVKRTTHYRYGL